MSVFMRSALTRNWNWQHGQRASTASALMSTASCSRWSPISCATGGFADQAEHAAAAQPVLAVVLHLHELNAGNRPDQFARRLVHSAGATDVAAIVPGHACLDLVRELSVPALSASDRISL